MQDRFAGAEASLAKTERSAKPYSRREQQKFRSKPAVVQVAAEVGLWIPAEKLPGLTVIELTKF